MAVEQAEAAGAGVEEIGFGEGAVEVVAAAQEALEHGVGDGDPLEDEMATGEAMAEGENLGQGDLFHQQEVMDDGEHEDEVELGIEAREQGEGFAVAPAGGGSGAGEVGVDGEDGEIALAGHAEDAVGGGLVALQCDDFRAERGGQRTEVAGVGSDVEDAGGVGGFEDVADPVELLAALVGGVVREGLRVVAPVGGGGARRGAEGAATQVLQGALEDVGCDFRIVRAGFILRCVFFCGRVGGLRRSSRVGRVMGQSAARERR